MLNKQLISFFRQISCKPFYDVDGAMSAAGAADSNGQIASVLRFKKFQPFGKERGQLF